MRVVLAVLLAVAVLAAVSPAVDQARRDRAVGVVEADLARIEAASAALAATEERTGAAAPGARRVVTVRVPPGGPTSARVAYVAIGAAPDREGDDAADGDVVAIGVAGREPRIRRLDVDLRVAGRDDAALVLRRPGTHRLVLRPTADGEAVAVARLERPDAATDRPGGSSAVARPGPAMNPLAWLDSGEASCGCRVDRDADRLVVTADDCADGGDLATAEGCRRTVVDALAERDASSVVVRTAGLDRVYDRVGGDLLRSAGRFVDRVAVHDERLAERARSEPLSAGEAAAARAGPVGRVAADTGLADLSARVESLDAALTPRVGLSMAGSLVDPVVPEAASLRATVSLPGGDRARLYDRADDAVPRYHLSPAGLGLSRTDRLTLAAARERLGEGAAGDGPRAPGRAVRRVADDDAPVERLATVLARHARGYGVVEALLADGAVSDVYATAPVTDRPLRVVRDGRTYRTNVRLTAAGARTVASRLRRASGDAFSRASPTVDAGVESLEGERIRVAGLTDPVSDGLAFAVRRRGESAWTLARLVAAGSLTPGAAALLSLAVRRDAAGLVAGPRGAGKTTTLGALLWELPAATRTVVVEDTPELPVDRLGAAGRDVQRLHASPDGAGPDPAGAVRTALRLGEGALVVGEVRGGEADALFEAMRVGKRGSAVLGTVHGEGGADVRDRVVDHLDVAPAAFEATDLVATMTVSSTETGRSRELATIEEHVGDGVFESLYDRAGEALEPTGRIDRGASRLVDDLAAPGESYADVRAALEERRTTLDRLAREGRTDPGATAPSDAGGAGGAGA